MLELYGHPFSSYTWKALIALYASETPFDFRMLGPDEPENGARVAAASPLGKFPLLIDGDAEVFEATSIIEHLWLRHPRAAHLLPADPVRAANVRMIDRVFDNYVMGSMQAVVDEHLPGGGMDPARIAKARANLERTYIWLERWLQQYTPGEGVGLIECAAAPSLFYADWVQPIPASCPRLGAYRGYLLALPPVARCVDDARPYRAFFPLGAPERD